MDLRDIFKGGGFVILPCFVLLHYILLASAAYNSASFQMSISYNLEAVDILKFTE